MSTATTDVKCPQCKHPKALRFFDCCDGSSQIWCFRCGFEKFSGPVRDPNGEIIEWKMERLAGVGAASYGETLHGGGGCICCFHKTQELTETEAWLRGQIASGKFPAAACYLTRWNKKTKNVESVLGTFFDEFDD
jgi:hypothetical protein